MTTETKFIVIAALVDTTALSLYKQDGSVVTIPQGDARLKPILSQCMQALKKEGDTLEIDISENNYYADYEKKTGGLTKFFRVAKSKVAEFFGKTEAKEEPVTPIVLGKVPGRGIPTVTAVVTKKAEFTQSAEEKLSSAVDEILANAVPSTDPAFAEPEKMPEQKKYQTVPDSQVGDTIIAVTNGQVIPGIEQIKTQIAAATTGSSKGLDAFMERISKVISKRRHSVEDLLKFLEKGDLPIADDGTIVAYKRLNRKTGNLCVDVHSGNVIQQVGSFVHMDESMVDPNRSQDCSHGLHIARRGYLGGFSGNVMVICKIKPEDVIAVPQYDANKVRVCGYHIVAELTDEQSRKLIGNRAMTDTDDAQILLGKILSGDHVGIIEYVKIGGPKGTDLTITPADNSKAAEAARVYEAKTKAPRKAVAISDEKVTAPVVDVKEVAQAITIAKEKEKGVHKPTLKETAAALLVVVISFKSDLGEKERAATQLVKLKKTSKKSWEALGVDEATRDTILKIAVPVSKDAIFATPETLAKAEAKVEKVKATGKPKEKPVAPKAVPNDKKETKADVAGRIWKAFNDAQPGSKKMHAQELLGFQKRVKKGWTVLGLPADAGDTLKKAIK